METPPVKFWHKGDSRLPAAVAASREPILRYFNYHDAHPIGLMMVLIEKFKIHWMAWEPETVQQEVIKSFKATGISNHNWQKLQAIRTLVHAVGFWEEWHTFEKVIQALNNNVPRFDITQRCTLAQLMAGVDIANTIRRETFSDEVVRYIAACALDDGVVYLPPPLDFAQGVLSKPMYRCRVCGTVDTDDTDGRCDFCTGRFQDDRPLNFKPSKAVSADVGTDVEKFLARDPAPVKKRFNELKLKDRSELDLSVSNVDSQTVKLLVAFDYMKLRQRQLTAQLEELKSWVTP
jgi:hypothetical protein